MSDTERGEAWARAQAEKATAIVFPLEWSPAERTVSAAFVAEAMVKWRASPSVAGFLLENAVIDGPVDIHSVAIEAEITFHACTFRQSLRARDVTFARRIRLVQCIFEEDFVLASCRLQDLWFTDELYLGESASQPGTVFKSSAYVLVCHVERNLCLDDARLAGPVSFESTSIGKCLYMRRASFESSAEFTALRVDYSVIGTHASFHSGDQQASFASVTVKGDLLLDDTVFGGPAQFDLAQIDSTLSLQRARFMGDDCTASFIGMRVGKRATLEQATFWGGLNLSETEIGGSLFCQRLEMLGTARPLNAIALKVTGHFILMGARIHGPADLSLMRVEGTLRCEEIAFLGHGSEVNFGHCHIGNAVNFNAATVQRPASFIKARFESIADFRSTTFSRGANFNSARIDSFALFSQSTFGGDALFPFIRVGGQLEITGATFNAALDLSASEIGGITRLSATVCKGYASFTNMVTDGDLQADRIEFEAEADFSFVSCQGKAAFDRALFRRAARFAHLSAIDASVTVARFDTLADFTGMRLAGNAHFYGSKFAGETRFNRAKISGDLKFLAAAADPEPDKVVFGSKLDCEAIEVGGTLEFNRCDAAKSEVELGLSTIGSAFLIDCTFGTVGLFATNVTNGLLFRGNVVQGPTSFRSLRVNGPTSLDGTTFHGVCDLGQASLQGVATFNILQGKPCHFMAGADFGKATVHRLAEFRGAIFDGKANFVGVQFLDESKFQHARAAGDKETSRVKFNQAADFAHAVFSGEASFIGVDFLNEARFPKSCFLSRATFLKVEFKSTDEACAVFAEAKFESQAQFSECKAAGRLAFFGARLDHRLILDSSCEFHDIDLRHARLTIVHIADDERRPRRDLAFLGSLRLGGCTYQQFTFDMQDATQLWHHFHKSLAPTNGTKFDRQPYLEFERVCRSLGMNMLADQVYFDLRSADAKVERRRPFQLWNRIERLVFGYGVKPIWLLSSFCLVWFAGALVVIVRSNLARGWRDVGDSFVISFVRLVPGVDKILKPSAAATSLPAYETLVVVVQYVIGWALLALLAHRFFKGLKR